MTESPVKFFVLDGGFKYMFYENETYVEKAVGNDVVLFEGIWKVVNGKLMVKGSRVDWDDKQEWLNCLPPSQLAYERMVAEMIVT